jgi:hypothetical protein
MNKELKLPHLIDFQVHKISIFCLINLILEKVIHYSIQTNKKIITFTQLLEN